MPSYVYDFLVWKACSYFQTFPVGKSLGKVIAKRGSGLEDQFSRALL